MRVITAAGNGLTGLRSNVVLCNTSVSAEGSWVLGVSSGRVAGGTSVSQCGHIGHSLVF